MFAATAKCKSAVNSIKLITPHIGLKQLIRKLFGKLIPAFVKHLNNYEKSPKLLNL